MSFNSRSVLIENQIWWNEQGWLSKHDKDSITHSSFAENNPQLESHPAIFSALSTSKSAHGPPMTQSWLPGCDMAARQTGWGAPPPDLKALHLSRATAEMLSDLPLLCPTSSKPAPMTQLIFHPPSTPGTQIKVAVACEPHHWSVVVLLVVVVVLVVGGSG